MEDLSELHALLSGNNLSRQSLARIRHESAKVLKIAVLRNHSFELVSATIDAFLALTGYAAEFHLSDYDDSFSALVYSDEVDILLIWADLDRYDAAGLNLMLSRFSDIAANSTVPVLVVPISERAENYGLLSGLSGKAVLVDPSNIQDKLGTHFFDIRLADFTGTRCSPRACLELSRLIGASAIPSVLLTPLKAVVVDLDNTLYSGVLGEDGVDGVVLSDGHKFFQEKLQAFASRGGFVCVVSKNDERDVETLFATRGDFPLKRNSITKIVANWRKKSENIASLEDFLNIHHSAMLFIDDNQGELHEVRRSLPEIHLLWASEDGYSNADAFSVYPGVASNRSVQDEDLIRSADVQAREERRLRQSNLSAEDYFRSLDVEISYALNQPADGPRVHALMNKTNQFIFNYKRYGEAEFRQIMNDPIYSIVTARMADKLVDSGIIAAAVLRRQADLLEVEELCVSCRALGRGLDAEIVLGMLHVAQEQFDADLPLSVMFQDGPRNNPARAFVNAHLASHIGGHAPFRYSFTNSLIRISKPESTVK